MTANLDEGWNILPEGWAWSDVGHGALDIAGLIPVIGEGADVTNAIWHAADGNYLDAGLSLISCIPIVGDLIGKGGKALGKVGGRTAKQALENLREIDFAKFLEQFRANQKLSRHIDKIAEALNKWRDELLGKFPNAPPGGTAPCPKTSAKARLRSSAVELRNLGPALARKKLLSMPPAQRKEILAELVADADLMNVLTAKGTAVFYSGRIRTMDGSISARSLAEGLISEGKTILEKTPGGRFLEALDIYPNAGNKMKGILDTDDADEIWSTLSTRYASSATGDVTVYVGEMRPGAILGKELKILRQNQVDGIVDKMNIVDMAEMFERLSK